MNRKNRFVKYIAMVASIMFVGFCIGIGIDYAQDFALSNSSQNPKELQSVIQENQTSSEKPKPIEETSSKENTSSETAKPPVSSAKPKPPVSSATPKPPVSSATPKPQVSSAAPKPPVSSATPKPPAPTPPPESNTTNAEMENIIFQKVNQLRRSLGLQEYTRNSKLDSSSQIRSSEMLATGLFSHTRPNNESCFTTIDAVGYNYQTCAENIGYCSGYSQNVIAETLFNGWLKSPGHYSAMVNPNYKEIGISVCGDSAMAYGTQHFGTQM